MCEFCIKHGEGKKWYLKAENYSTDMLSDLRRRRFVEDFFFWIDRAYRYKFPILKVLPYKAPVVGGLVKRIVRKYFQNNHWGQVVPIEDVERILSITNSITRVPCICRAATTGREVRVCFLICLNPGKLGMADVVDRSYFDGPDVSRFENVSREWALEFIRQSEPKGMFHTVWTFKAPFIGGLCNCEFSSGCIPMKMYDKAVPIVFKAEYAAVVDRAKCTGCRRCISICQFKAVEWDVPAKKAAIDPVRCYGCGICRSVCRSGAITLEGLGEEPSPAMEYEGLNRR
jgi:ferredoxin